MNSGAVIGHIVARLGTHVPKIGTYMQGSCVEVGKHARKLRKVSWHSACMYLGAPGGLPGACKLGSILAQRFHMSKSAKLSAPKATPKAAAPAPVQGMHGGVPLANLPRNIAVRGANLGTLRPPMAQAVLVVGRPYRMGASHTAQWGAQALALAAKGTTGAAMAQAGVPAHMVSYMVRRGYLLAKA